MIEAMKFWAAKKVVGCLWDVGVLLLIFVIFCGAYLIAERAGIARKRP